MSIGGDDPLHQASPAGITWTTANIGEAITGVPTPLSWSLWRHAMVEGSLLAYQRMGVMSRREVDELRADPLAVVGIFHGHPAINVDLATRAIARVPGYDPAEFRRQYFSLEPSTCTERRARRRWAAIAARAPLAASRIGREITAARRDTEAWWRRSIDRTLDGSAAPRLLAEARERFASVMVLHFVQSQAASGLYARLTDALGRAGLAGLEARLVTGAAEGETMEESRLALDLWAMSRDELGLNSFLARHGYHGPDESELSSPSWREDPEPVEALAKAYAGQPDARSPAETLERQRLERTTAEEQVRAHVGRVRAAVILSLAAAARRSAARRETGKASFLFTIDVARRAARSWGAALADDGRLDAPGDVFYWTWEELTGEVTGVAVAERRRQRAAHQATELPTTWTGVPVLWRDDVPRRDIASAETEGELRGIGASPGRITGPARVVLDPGTCRTPVGPDEVLVARTTDPSWVTLFLSAGALVVDVGGPMSHAAIVARDLGVPCVIGTGDGTRRIADGDVVTVDGSTGTVTLPRFAVKIEPDPGDF